MREAAPVGETKTGTRGRDALPCHVDWGPEGAAAAAERGDVLVVVDVLSFGTTVATAVQAGATIFPCSTQQEAWTMAQSDGVQAAIQRRDAIETGRFSLSPLTMLTAGPGDKISVASPNGATCCRMGESAHVVLVAGLVNAHATARVASRIATENACDITVIACGERHVNGTLRPAIEDWLGAGAIVSHLREPKSAEAEMCRLAYLAVHDRVKELVRDSESGRELHRAGFPGDIDHASGVDRYHTAVIMRHGWLIAHENDGPR